MIARVWSATSSIKTSGTLVTGIPAAGGGIDIDRVGATLPQLITTTFSRPAMISALMWRPRAITASRVLGAGDEVGAGFGGDFDDFRPDRVEGLAFVRVGLGARVELRTAALLDPSGLLHHDREAGRSVVAVSHGYSLLSGRTHAIPRRSCQRPGGEEAVRRS